MTRLTDVSASYPAIVDAECETALEVQHPELGLLGFICIHDSRQGPGVGGVRRRPYTSSAAALADAASLAAQMTWKTRFAQLPCGGAKAVIMDRPGLDLERAYRAFGEAVDALEGRYFCGPDIGTGTQELTWIRESTNYVNAPENDASEATARGVLAGIRACLSHRQMSDGLSVVLQGVGRVGGRVARGLMDRTDRLYLADPSEAARAVFEQAHTLDYRDNDRVVTHESDLFCPCAVGPVITVQNVDRLRCGLVCGSANTQLAHPDLAERLMANGVLYAPDFVVNAGAVIEGILVLQHGERGRALATQRIDEIETRLLELFEESERTKSSPLQLAQASVRAQRPAPNQER